MSRKRKNRDFVNKYDELRSILKDMFLYGCFNVDDFKAKGTSSSKYNVEKRRLVAFIDNQFIDQPYIEGKKVVTFKTDMFQVAYNYLLATHMMKSFNDSHVRYAILVLQLFNGDNNSFTKTEIYDSLATIGPETTIGSDQILNRVLADLAAGGNLVATMDKNKIKYSLPDDIFSDLPADLLRRIMMMVDFFSNIIYPSTPGGFLFNTLERYIKYNQFHYETPFMFKHYHLAHILDDQVLWDIVIAIYGQKTLSFDYYTDVTAHYETRHYDNTIPLKIIADEAYGRRYMICIKNRHTPTPDVFRLDKMTNLKQGDSFQLEINATEAIQQLQYSISGACLPAKDGTPFRVQLLMSSDTAKRIKDETDLLIGEEETDDGIILTLLINDPVELKPWIRRYTGRIKILPNSEHCLAEELESELICWRELYEDIL